MSFDNVSLPPTLDRVRWEIPTSFAGGLAGIASRRMKLFRRFIADRAVRTKLIIIATPSLAFLAGLVEALQPVRVQALGPEPAIQALNERVISGPPWTREVKRKAANKRPQIEITTGELRAAVDMNRSRTTDIANSLLQARYDISALEGMSDVTRRRQTREGVDHR